MAKMNKTARTEQDQGCKYFPEVFIVLVHI